MGEVIHRPPVDLSAYRDEAWTVVLEVMRANRPRALGAARQIHGWKFAGYALALKAAGMIVDRTDPAGVRIEGKVTLERLSDAELLAKVTELEAEARRALSEGNGTP
jgi:hypothetical protein